MRQLAGVTSWLPMPPGTLNETADPAIARVATTPLGPAGTSPALKSRALRLPSLTSTERTADFLICLAPTLSLASPTAAYDVPPSATTSASSATWWRLT